MQIYDPESTFVDECPAEYDWVGERKRKIYVRKAALHLPVGQDLKSARTGQPRQWRGFPLFHLAFTGSHRNDFESAVLKEPSQTDATKPGRPTTEKRGFEKHDLAGILGLRENKIDIVGTAVSVKLFVSVVASHEIEMFKAVCDQVKEFVHRIGNSQEITIVCSKEAFLGALINELQGFPLHTANGCQENFHRRRKTFSILVD